MTRRKQAQRTLWEGVVKEDVRALYEPWMIEAGPEGMKRWVGLGVMADTLTGMGNVLAART